MNLFEQNNPKLFPETERQSFNVSQERIEKLKELFPNIVSDGKIDWKTLKLMLGENITEEDERYRFTWSGKTKAIQEVGIPTTKTLRPDKESSKNWDTTENLYIEGDNLEVLKILQNSYNGKIKMIYIDPPYNTGNDFIYKDNFTLTTEEVEKQEGLKDKKGITKTVDRLTKNSKDSAKYHTNWLNMMYPRLSIARDLLTDDGVIFISIDENEIHNLRKLCDEIFGEENFISTLIWQKKFSRANDATYFSTMHDYILCYCKFNINTNINGWKIGLLPRGKELPSGYSNPDNDLRGPWTSVVLSAKSGSENLLYEIETPSGRKVLPPSGRFWCCNKETFEKWKKEGRIWFGNNGDGIPRKKTFLSEVQNGLRPNTILFYSEVGHNQEGKQETKSLFNGIGVFDGPKPIKLLKILITIANLKQDSIILDFFSGSATTAHAVMQLNAEDCGNRKFIMVQVPEVSYEGKKNKDGNYVIDEKTGLPEIQKDSEARKAGFNLITEIGKERIRRAGEKIKSDKNLSEENREKLDIGFKTFKLDSSNFNEWDTSYEAMKKAVEESSEGRYTTYKQDRNELDLVYEIMLKEGLQLTEKVEEINFEENTIYKIADGVMYVFLGKLTKGIVDKIIELKKEVQESFGLDNPTVILNETYLDSEIKGNAKKNFEVNGIISVKTL